LCWSAWISKGRLCDARHIYRQVDRAHREWTPAQVGFLANIVRLYRHEQPDFTTGGKEAESRLAELFHSARKGEGFLYRDIPGLCKASDEDFKEQLETLNEELETLNAAARELEATIASNVTEILET
jgi:type I restriction enzyme M protein